MKLENVKEEITESTPKNDGLSFSKLDFVIKDKKPLTKKEKREKLSGRDYASLQKKVEKRTQYLQKLSEKNPEKAKGLEEKIAWDVMAKRAAGQKVKVSLCIYGYISTLILGQSGFVGKSSQSKK